MAPPQHQSAPGRPAASHLGLTWRKAAELRLARDDEIYAVQACPFEPHTAALVAAGGPSVARYLLDPKTGQFSEQARYTAAPQHVDDKEAFYACTWARLRSGDVVVAAAGLRGDVHVLAFDLAPRALLRGHGQSVNCVETCPAAPDLLLTASADESVRLWNMATGAPLASLHGDGGHLAEVLHVSWHATKPWLVASVGLDDAVIIWSLLPVLEAAEEAGCGGARFVHVERPLLRTRAVHADFVDTVAWHGDRLCTKSVHDQILLWALPASTLDATPAASALPPPREGVCVTDVFDVPDCSVWFVKFAVDRRLRRLACGSLKGRAYVWALPGEHTAPQTGPMVGGGAARETVVVDRGDVTVRSVALHADNILVAGMDDGRVVVMKGSAAGSGAGSKSA